MPCARLFLATCVVLTCSGASFADDIDVWWVAEKLSPDGKDPPALVSEANDRTATSHTPLKPWMTTTEAQLFGSLGCALYVDGRKVSTRTDRAQALAVIAQPAPARKAKDFETFKGFQAYLAEEKRWMISEDDTSTGTPKMPSSVMNRWPVSWPTSKPRWVQGCGRYGPK